MSEGRALTVALWLPGKGLSPNGRPHFMARARLVRLHRDWAKLAALSALQSRGWSRRLGPYFPRPVRVDARVLLPPRKQRWDVDNFIAACKPYLDGFTDAGVWSDDRDARWGDITWERCAAGCGEVVLRLTEEG